MNITAFLVAAYLILRCKGKGKLGGALGSPLSKTVRSQIRLQLRVMRLEPPLSRKSLWLEEPFYKELVQRTFDALSSKKVTGDNIQKELDALRIYSFDGSVEHLKTKAQRLGILP